MFYSVFEGNFQVQAPPGGRGAGSVYLEGWSNRGFFAAVPVWGVYIWRGLLSEFYGIFMISWLKNTKTVLVDTDIPVEDLLKPENETLHSIDSTGEGYKLFALVVTAEDGRFYSCVKPEADADKW